LVFIYVLFEEAGVPQTRFARRYAARSEESAASKDALRQVKVPRPEWSTALFKQKER